MPDTKNFSLRVIILDGLLKRTEGTSMQEMLENVNNKLDKRGISHVKSKITILRDLDEISNRFFIKIVKIRDPDDGRIIRYRYEDIRLGVKYMLPILSEYKWQIEQVFKFCAVCLGKSFTDWAEELFRLLEISIQIDYTMSNQIDQSLKDTLKKIFVSLMNDDPLSKHSHNVIESIKKMKKCFR